MNRVMGVVAGSIFLFGCNTVLPSYVPSVSTGTSIVPAGTVRLAEVYRTSVRLDQITGPVDIKPFCPNDFTNTEALKTIRAKYDVANGDPRLDEGFSQTKGWNAGINGIDFGYVKLGGSFAPSATATASYQKVSYYQVDDADLQTVNSKLGARCKSDIKKWSSQGYGVFLVSGAYKAGTIKIEVTKGEKLEGQAGFTILKIAPSVALSANNSETTTLGGTNLYYRVVQSPL